MAGDILLGTGGAIAAAISKEQVNCAREVYVLVNMSDGEKRIDCLARHIALDTDYYKEAAAKAEELVAFFNNISAKKFK